MEGEALFALDAGELEVLGKNPLGEGEEDGGSEQGEADREGGGEARLVDRVPGGTGEEPGGGATLEGFEHGGEKDVSHGGTVNTAILEKLANGFVRCDRCGAVRD